MRGPAALFSFPSSRCQTALPKPASTCGPARGNQRNKLLDFFYSYQGMRL